MKLAAAALVILLMAFLTGCVTWRLDENYFFNPLAMDVVGERVEIEGDGGILLVGRFLKHPQARGTLVYFGGNAEYLDFSGKTLRKLSEHRLNVLMVDYRGYGYSAGTPAVDRVLADSVTVFRYARRRPEAQGLPLLAYGFSLGGFAAAYVASQEACDGLILEATGTDVKSWTDLLLRWYLKPFVRVRIDEKLLGIDNVARVRQYDNPLLVMAGKADDQVPALMSQRLFDASRSKEKSLHIFAVGNHGLIKEEPDFDRVFSAFLEKIARGRSST